MNELEDKNQAIREQNKIAVRELEEFYVNGTINDITKAIDTLKEEKVNEIIEYANTHEKTIYNKSGDPVGTYVEVKPIVISNYFFRSICPLHNKVPIYNAEKLGIVFEYYNYLISEINDKIGNYPPSLLSFCKLAGISYQTLRDYKNSSDIEMRNVVEKIYDQLGDDNLTMSQMGQVKEKSTIFKLKAQHEMVEKVQPNVNITYKEVVNTDRINANLEKYKDFIEKKGE